MRFGAIMGRITGKKFPSYIDVRKYYAFFLPYAAKYWFSYLILLVTVLFSVCTTLAYAWFLKGIMEAAVAHDLARIGDMIVFGITFYALNVIVGFINTYVTSMTMNRVKRDVKVNVLSYVMRLPASMYNRHQSGDLMSRVTNDTDVAVGAVGTNLINIIRLPFTAVAAFVYLFGMNRSMSLTLLAFGPVALIAASIFSKYIRLNGRKIQDQTGKMVALLNEILSGNTIIRAFNLERVFHKRYASEAEHYLRLQNSSVKLSGGFRIGTQIASSSAFLLCLGIGATDVARGTMTAGSLLAFISLMQHLVTPFTGMARQFGGLQRSMAAAERLWEVLDVPVHELSNSSELEWIQIGSGLRLENVSFSYDGKKKAVDGVSITIPGGTVAAFVGPSGAGKSTLFNLLLRFYDADSGTIYLNRRSYSSFYPAELRQSIAYVPQESYLFSGSFRENILYGRPDATEEEMVAAATDANIHDFILTLPEQYETQIGERGIRLSGGQKQRLAIARAILKDAPILLLDEATSALDSANEQLVQEALERLMADRTTLIIAHRLSTIQRADMIVAMNDGQVMEMGTHAELISKGGLYAKMHQLQFRDNAQLQQRDSKRYSVF